MSRLAKDFGVSDVAIKKKCKKLNIPTPGLGSWAKIQAGKTVKRKPLPKIQGKERAKYRFQKSTFRSENFGLEDLDLLADNLLSDCIDDHTNIKVKDQLKSPHPLVALTRTKLKERFSEGCEKAGPSGCLSLYVSRKNRVRSLRILEAICRKSQVCGFKVWPSDDRSDSRIAIDGAEVSFQLVETNKLATEVWPCKSRRRTVPIPPGAHNLLRFEIRDYVGDGVQGSWSDTKTAPIEDKIDRIFHGLVRGAYFIKKRKERWELEEQERERKRKEREEADRVRRLETKRREALLEGSEGHDQAKKLRQFIASVEDLFEMQIYSEEYIKKKRDWATWAKGVADELDPLAKLSKGNFEFFEEPQEEDSSWVGSITKNIW